jgi:hypothetical protein
MGARNTKITLQSADDVRARDLLAKMCVWWSTPPIHPTPPHELTELNPILNFNGKCRFLLFWNGVDVALMC